MKFFSSKGRIVLIYSFHFFLAFFSSINVLLVYSLNQFKASPNYAQLPQGHMVARNQPMPYTNAPTASPAIQQSSAVSLEDKFY